MPRPQSEAPDLHLERARDRVGGSGTAWCTDYWRGEHPVQGWWWRRSQKSNKPSKPPEIYKNGEKRAFSQTFWQIISRKCHFSLTSTEQDILTRCFFKEYMNFKTHYLRHCRVIPLRSFGSHIRPQPHGLGLTQHTHSKEEIQNTLANQKEGANEFEERVTKRVIFFFSVRLHGLHITRPH